MNIISEWLKFKIKSALLLYIKIALVDVYIVKN
jgi:hypothetical protein